jgi:hypothetical protein
MQNITYFYYDCILKYLAINSFSSLTNLLLEPLNWWLQGHESDLSVLGPGEKGPKWKHKSL